MHSNPWYFNYGHSHTWLNLKGKYEKSRVADHLTPCVVAYESALSFWLNVGPLLLVKRQRGGRQSTSWHVRLYSIIPKGSLAHCWAVEYRVSVSLEKSEDRLSENVEGVNEAKIVKAGDIRDAVCILLTVEVSSKKWWPRNAGYINRVSF